MQDDAGVEHPVGHRERVGEGGLLVGDAEQVLVRHDDQGVDGLLQLVDAGFGEPHAALALELEGLGHDADGEDAHVAGRAGHDRGRARAGAAAHAGGDEHHVRAGEVVADLVDDLLGGGAADFRLRAGAEALGHLHAHLDDPVGLGHGQRLRVGVADDELAALQAELDHVVDGVAAGAADAEHGDPGLEFADVRNLEIDRHCLGLSIVGAPQRRLLHRGRKAAAAPPSRSAVQKLSLSHRPMRDR